VKIISERLLGEAHWGGVYGGWYQKGDYSEETDILRLIGFYKKHDAAFKEFRIPGIIDQSHSINKASLT